ncbi:MAG: TonB-dependent receptor domain-containing protein [Gemmatimonadaceae bacterium]
MKILLPASARGASASSPFIRAFALPVAFLFALAAVGAVAEAQSGTVRGRVILAGTGTPVGGGLVSVIGTARGVGTDDDGSFQIIGLTPGNYEIEGRRIGTTVARVAVTVRQDETADITLRVNEAPVEIVGVEVVGSRADALSRLPGSAAVISAQELHAMQPLSANEALRTLPGVHVQEEEGVGLRANVGIRGLDPDRSRTLLVLEDGVPVALAPYGEPEMYYSPPIDRMHRVELVKGSGSILFGPQTIGGVLNYVTADAPSTATGSVTLRGGEGRSRLIQANYGGSWSGVRGNIGAFDKRARDLAGLWFAVSDVTGKLGARTAVGEFGLKATYYDERSSSTYVGLTQSMYDGSPYTHPAPNDLLHIRRYAVTASHETGFLGNSSVRTSAYAYQTTRDWRRQDYGYTADGSQHVFRNSTGNRNRSFDVAGIEPRFRTVWSRGGKPIELDFGMRLHYERARDQHVNGATATASSGEVRDDEIRVGKAVSAFVQNRFFVTPTWHVTPGLRIERFTYDRNILRARVRRATSTGTTRKVEDVDIVGGDAVSEVIPGIGTAWTPSPLLTLFAGVHRGFAPPRVKDGLVYPDPTLAAGEQIPELQTLSLDAERSLNYELGTRLAPLAYLSLEATAFYLDFTNQIIEPSLSAGSAAEVALANQGATHHRGVEAALSLDIAKAMGRPFGLVARFAATRTAAEFSKDRFLRSLAGDTVNVRGNRLPYAPAVTASASLTLDHPSGVLFRLDGLHVGEQFADNFETRAGSANGRVGLIPAYRVFDLSARYRLPGLTGLSLSAAIKNIAANKYVASRRPEGIKPGLPRTMSAGLEWRL